LQNKGKSKKNIEGLKLVLVLLSILGMILASGCGAAGNKTGSGNSVTGSAADIRQADDKIAVLFSSYAQIWKLAGGSVDITVGESIERGFADEDCVLVDEGAGHSNINMEILLSERPSLVIGTSDYSCQKKAVELCIENGIDAKNYRVECFDDYLAVLKEFTELTGNEEAYTKYGLDVKTRIDSILSSIPETDNLPRVLFLRASSSAKATKAKNAENNFVCRMINELGAVNIADKAEVLLDSLSLETIVTEDPDIILLSPMGDEEAAKAYIEALFTEAGWRDLKAVKNHNYYFLDKELFHFKPNNRWDEAYQQLKDLLY